MQLWNDYEGRTIAEAYPLEKLLSPEGRSAFFSTSNGTGTPAVIRLIEAHFDEEEILARWRQVAEIKQTNLVAMRKYGQTVLDGTALVYAVMEPTEASLADVLKDRPLTIEETRQIATSLIAALEALHTRNLIHEHIEPANVLAAGEIIKLRSDCVREAPDGQEGIDLKARDVHDLATVLLQSLTLQRTLSSGTSLPAPFNEVIRNGISGAWGLPQIGAALTLPAPSPRKPAATTADAATTSPRTATGSSTRPGPPPAPVAPVAPAPSVPAPSVPAPSVKDRIIRPVTPAPSRRPILGIASAVGILLLLLLGWHFLHTTPATPAKNSTLATVGREDTPPTSANNPPPPQAAPAAAPAVEAKPAPDGRTQWRVVAYTYNHQEQAQQKVDLIARQHASLNPEIFTPNGRAPYLVTVGGPMTREEAAAFRKKARAAGLPRDTYTQNYSR
jgi:hypothetical protein